MVWSDAEYRPAIAFASVLLVTSLLPLPGSAGEELPTLLTIPLDKWVHAASYALLTGSLARGSRDTAAVATVTALAICYGVGIELLQGLVPSRGLSGADMLANAVGATLAGVLWSGGRSR